MFKLHLTGIETWNITSRKRILFEFKLHLTGIETTGGHNCRTGFVRFKLHLTGIETWKESGDRDLRASSNCTLLELKLEKLRLANICQIVQIAPYWN